MKNLCSLTMSFMLTAFTLSSALSQEMEWPKPGPEYKILNDDVGTWDVEIKTWTDTGEPTISKGNETNRMLGGFWLLSDFQGNMMGMNFKGHGVYSYDKKQNQYVGTWVDSLSPNKMDMVGKHDPVNQTMTYEGFGPGADGKPAKHVMTTKYQDDGTRVMTMQMQAGETTVTIFKMSYTKATSSGTSKE